MSRPCPCGSPLTVRHGADAVSHLRMSAGKPERAPCMAFRYLCKACGRTFAAREAAVDESEREVREHVAELAFRMGRSGAVRATGLSASVVARLLDEWREAREADTLDASPDFILIETARLRDGDAVLVADVDGRTLVGVFQDHAELDGWIRRRDLPPLRACMPIDAGLLASVRRTLPDATVMVAPSSVARAISAALGAGLGALRRDPAMRNRNAFPGTARFLRAVDGRATLGEGWPREVTSLLFAGRLARDVAGARDAGEGGRLFREFELAVATPGGGPLARLMATWRDAILSGLDHRFVDGMARIMAQVRRLASARRPSLVVRDFRALALLRDYQRGSGPGYLGGLPFIAHGRPLAGLDALIRGDPGAIGGA